MSAQPRSPTFWRMPAAAVLVLLSALGVHEGSKASPYRDVNGVWTVCKGVTGPDVIPGRRYSTDECAALEGAYISRMAENMGHCVNQPLTFGEWVGYGHFAYNIGTAGFCNSSIVRTLKAGDHKGACKRISRYVYVGGRDCRIRGNNCYGIVTRRAYERSMCERDL